ncbi:odorant receptor 67d-like [Uranotaenia lowii]|uniref:odorant receptor 67d-like n=1 Tax=Uranotaenia lowii TaxID=190385 RepID=UPI00247959D5|nr:odorant receptor 67d-like [Uranotaenia lowii]
MVQEYSPQEVLEKIFYWNQFMLRICGLDVYSTGYCLGAMGSSTVALTLSVLIYSAYSMYIFRDDRLTCNLVLVPAIFFIILYDLLLHKIAGLKDKPDKLPIHDFDDSEFRFKLREVIEWHQDLIEYIIDVKNLLTGQIFVEISCNALQVVAVLFVLQNVSWWPGFTLTLTCLIQMGLMCYLGTLIDTKDDLLSEMIYDVPWHSMDPVEQKKILLMLAVAQNSTNLTCGHMAQLNLNFYLQIIKKIYSILMMLKNI